MIDAAVLRNLRLGGARRAFCDDLHQGVVGGNTLVGHQRHAEFLRQVGHAVDVPDVERLLRRLDIERLQLGQQAEGIVVIEGRISVDPKRNLVAEPFTERFRVAQVFPRVDTDLQDQMTEPLFEELIRRFQQ